MAEEMRINIPFEVTEQFIEDVMITAYDSAYGGSRYWGYLKGKMSDIEMFAFGKQPVQIIEVGDGPDRTKRVFTRDDFVRGFQMWVDFLSARGRFSMMRLEDIDADDADAIVQFGLFGELVYG